MKKRKLPSDATLRRRVERKERKELDPWFGSRRPTSFPNGKAKSNKSACRGRMTEGY